MTRPPAEYQETTLTFEPSAGTVELYTTSRAAFLRAVTRNPNYRRAEELFPGYRLVYDLKDCRQPESVIRPADGGAEFVAKHWLTPAEKANRASASERLKKVRPDASAVSRPES